MATLLEPFAYGYMTNAMWVSALVGAVCAFLSAFLMLKGWSLIGDALSHSIVPGVAGAYMLGLPFALGAFIAGGLAAGSMLFLTERSGLKVDTIIGLIFTSFFRLGLFMVSLSPTSVDVQTIVLGNILAVTASDTIQLVIIATVSLAILTMKWKDLMLHAFDPAQARASGLPVTLLHYGLLTLLSLTIVATLSATGLILAVGLLIAPGAIAFLVVRSFGPMLIVSVLVCLLSMFAGVYASFFLDSAPAPTIVLILTVIFVLAFINRLLVTRRTSRQAARG